MAEFDDGGKQRVIGEKSLNDTENAPWNFQNTKNIGQDIAEAKRLDPAAGGYDHIWKFTEGLDTHTITLKNPDNNLQLDVTTDANAVIMYSNCYPNNNLEMITGETDGLYNAITIEPYTFFKSDDVSPLNITPDKTFSRYISYKLS